MKLRFFLCGKFYLHTLWFGKSGFMREWGIFLLLIKGRRAHLRIFLFLSDWQLGHVEHTTEKLLVLIFKKIYFSGIFIFTHIQKHSVLDLVELLSSPTSSFDLFKFCLNFKEASHVQKCSCFSAGWKIATLHLSQRGKKRIINFLKVLLLGKIVTPVHWNIDVCLYF